jgi:hypothetical protein
MKSYEPKFEVGDLLMKIDNFPEWVPEETKAFIVVARTVGSSTGGFGRYGILENSGVESWSWTAADKYFKIIKE